MQHKAKWMVKETTPTIVNGAAPPQRVANATLRPRAYLTAEEIKQMVAARRWHSSQL